MVALSSVAEVAEPAPSSGVHALAPRLVQPEALVLAAIRSGVATHRIVAAVAAGVSVAARKASDRHGALKACDAAERAAQGDWWLMQDGRRAEPYAAGAIRMMPHHDTYEALSAGSKMGRACPADRAVAELCQAVLDDEVALAGGELTDEAKMQLSEAVSQAAKVVGEEAVSNAVLGVIRWSEIEAEIESAEAEL